MRIAIVTDAWAPQVNGVVRTLQAVRAELERAGHAVLIVAPDQFASLPCPTYPEIRLAMARTERVGAMLAAFAPDAIHLATEGPLCLAARRWCLRHGLAFTTAYHTQFPDYVARRTGMPAEWVWRYIRWFHAPASGVLASTPSIRRLLASHGITALRHWGRGVDLGCFTPDAPPPALYAGLPRPIQLYVGRIAVEKNVEAFLRAAAPGSKVVVGEGPARAALEARHPAAHFTGALAGRALAGAYAGADVFVFPSRTDTFGLVMIEALACGTPVAAYPVPGPLDVLTAATGAMDEDLAAAIPRALALSRTACAAEGRRFSWAESAAQFVAALVPPGGECRAAA
ncbi:glycosyltransferase family 4 protein [Sphingomonas flavalba]|uniref:glycosyltransferase family 4 protein n=1 Tax=Sphingomonas flavalba TaxID=2559804 RepID=UPI00109DE43A|nr:glycosyltransferase family 1 protein [Sphingomonas flavalba]